MPKPQSTTLLCYKDSIRRNIPLTVLTLPKVLCPTAGLNTIISIRTSICNHGDSPKTLAQFIPGRNLTFSYAIGTPSTSSLYLNRARFNFSLMAAAENSNLHGSIATLVTTAMHWKGDVARMVQAVDVDQFTGLGMFYIL